MPLLEQYYELDDPPGFPFPLFAGAGIDPRNNAILAAGEDTVTITGVICAQSIIPLYSGGLPNGLGQDGAQIEEKYRPAKTVRVVGWNTDKPSVSGGFLPEPPELAETPGAHPEYGAPMVVFITPGGNIRVGSFEFFSAFFEPCSVNFSYIAANPPEIVNPPPPPPGGGFGAAGNAMHGVVRLDGR